MANLEGTLREGFDPVAIGLPTAPWHDRDALTLRVADVDLSFRRDLFSTAELIELNGGAGQQLVMHYQDLVFTLSWQTS